MSESDSDSVESLEPNTNEPTPETAADEPETAESALAEAEAKAAEHWDRYLRTAAELENVRKRAARDVDQARKFAVERFAGDLLAVADSLSMGLEAAESSSVDRLREGTEATLKLLNQVFERFGIAVVDPHGEPFNPEQHEAMTMQPSPDAEPGSVLAVVQRGYTLNGRLLRPARVVVAAEVPETSNDA
ncbi:MAG: nucleotide exchange factor GrpE [Pseudomonadota bacterium]